MSPEQQRIALAKWARWQSVRPFNNGTEIKPVGFAPDDPFPHDKGEQFVPDYLHDLNAVQTLLAKWAPDKNEMESYLRNLKAIVAPHYEPHEVLCVWCMCNATAAQRCEALLRTLGLWEE